MVVEQKNIEKTILMVSDLWLIAGGSTVSRLSLSFLVRSNRLYYHNYTLFYRLAPCSYL